MQQAGSTWLIIPLGRACLLSIATFDCCYRLDAVGIPAVILFGSIDT